jgi:hypothetical protein
MAAQAERLEAHQLGRLRLLDGHLLDRGGADREDR